MTTYEMLESSILAKKSKGALTESYIISTKKKMDVFLMNDRINNDEYNALNELLK